jgi:cell division transport system permease protein
MLATNLKRVAKAGLFSFLRNSFVSLSSILTMVITLSVIGSLVFMNGILNSVLSSVKDKVNISVSFLTTANENDILAMKKSIENLPEVEQVDYISKDQELTDFRQRHQNDQITLQALDELGNNPLGATLNIKAKDPSQYEGIASYLQGDNLLSKEGTTIVDNVNYYQNKVAIDRLSQIITLSEKLSFAFTIILIIISILVTFNTIRLVIFISREEISVMKLVGASSLYIRGPFVIGGVLYGLAAGLLVMILFYPLTMWFGRMTQNFFVGFNIFGYYLMNFGEIFLIVIGSGILIGAVSSYLAVRRYLKS